jgi:MFS transporter, ACS family, tartrate transporter
VADAEALERTTLAKVTRRLLPFLFLLYIVCFLDRVNLGFAALQMNHDLGFSPAVWRREGRTAKLGGQAIEL